MQSQSMLAFIIGSCVAILLIVAFPMSLLRKLGGIVFLRFRPFAPNWITFYSIPITVCGIYLWLFQGESVWGMSIAIFGAFLDRIDGRMAYAMGETLPLPETWIVNDKGEVFADVTDRKGNTENKKIGIAQSALGKWWIEFNWRGGTDLGKVFDPFADKVKSIYIMVCFVFLGLLNPWIVGAMVIPEIVGTLMRRPFTFLKKWIHSGRATAVGKWKVILQWTALVLCIPYQEQWIHERHWAAGLDWAPSAILALSLVFAVGSVFSRFKWVRKSREIDKMINTLEETTNHE